MTFVYSSTLIRYTSKVTMEYSKPIEIKFLLHVFGENDNVFFLNPTYDKYVTVFFHGCQTKSWCGTGVGVDYIIEILTLNPVGVKQEGQKVHIFLKTSVKMFGKVYTCLFSIK